MLLKFYLDTQKSREDPPISEDPPSPKIKQVPESSKIYGRSIPKGKDVMVLWELEGSSRKTLWNEWKTLGLRRMEGNDKPSEGDRQKELKEEEQEEKEEEGEGGGVKKEEGENDLCSFR